MYTRRCLGCRVDKDKQNGYILRRWSTARLCRECELIVQSRRHSIEYRQSLLETILSYAAAGLRVMPLHTPILEPQRLYCSCGRRCLHLLGKHPRIENNTKLASSDPETIRKWWNEWPDANVAIATGSGLAVLDLDPQNGYAKSDLHSNISVTTGYGKHLYYKLDRPLLSQNQFIQGVDLRADEGYVVAPPSIHHSFVPYSWDSPFEQGKLEPLPNIFFEKSKTAVPYYPYQDPGTFKIWEEMYRTTQG